MKKNILIVFLLVVGLCIYLLSLRQNDLPKQKVEPVDAYQALIRENFVAMDKTVQIFAKVVDGDTNMPLQGAIIEVNYKHSSPIPPLFSTSSNIKAVSDKNGFIFIDNIKCRKFYLNQITLENYWEKGQKNTFPNYDFITYTTNKDNPAIFKLFKEVKDNYLFKSEARLLQVIEGETCINYFGLLERFNVKREQEKYDFQFTADLKDNKTIINLKGFDSSCSFYLSDKDVLDQKELSRFENILIIEETKDVKILHSEERLRNLFIKFGKLQLYVRAKLKIRLNKFDSFIEFYFEINPYGEYNFETFDIGKLSLDTRIAIKDELESKLKKGVLPKREDLKKFLNIPVSEKTTKLIEDKHSFDIKKNLNNSAMSFYGKVLDDKGKAIPEAIVAFQYFFYDDKNKVYPRRKKVKTDKNGVFLIDNVYGYRLRIVDIFKYEYFRNRVIRGNFEDRFFINNFSDSYLPNKDKPEEFHLVNELSGNFNDNNQFFVPRIIKFGEEKEFLLKYLNELESRNSENFDLKVNIQLLKEKCVVNISSREENGVFFISDSENIGESDQKNIHKGSFDLFISNEGKTYKRYEKYLLVKFLNDRFYAKLRLDILIGNLECQFYVENKINLFGTKDFDDFKKTKYTGRIYKHLREHNELKASNGEMEGVLDKNDFIKDYNNPLLKTQFSVPPGTDPRLEYHIDEMKEFLQYRIFEEDEKLINP